MPLMNPLAMLDDARRNGYCVGAFNVVDYLSIETVVEAAEKCQAPVIMQASSGTLKRFGVRTVAEMAKVAAARGTVPLALHLDHGTDRKHISEAIEYGFSSVMIDASSKPFEENVAITKEVVAEARPRGVAVEGEIGVVAGVEDDIVVNHDKALYTTPEEALEFKRRSDVDFLAAAIGTAHGFYKVEPKLDIDTLRRIHQTADFPLVVHGGTGLPDAVVRALVDAGAAKFNVSTKVKQVYTDALFDYIQAHRGEYNILKVLENARKELVAMVEGYIRLLGGAGKAANFR